MEHNSPVTAAIALSVTFITGFFGWINWTMMETWLKTGSLFISMGAGIMAMRYYYHATKEKQRK